MKEGIKLPIREVVLLGTLVIVLIFLTRMIFGNDITKDSPVKSMVQPILESSKEKEIVKDNDQRIQEIIQTESPEIRYMPKTFSVGETFWVNELLQVKKTGSEEYISATEEGEFSVAVLDIRDNKGKSYKLQFMKDNDTAEELADVMLEESTGRICFNKSGIYILRVIVWGEQGRTTLGEITLPIETN